MAEFDGIKEAHNKIPRGWVLFFVGVIVWLVWYIVSYTPQISGWSQYKVFEEEMKAAAVSTAGVAGENPYKNSAAAVEEGRALFASNCSMCHGADLKGGVGPDLTGRLKYGDDDGQMFTTVSEGRPGGMPAFGQQLGRERIWKVLAYVGSVRERGGRP
ncbi:MAG TPA: c-type cytochrome [Nitrospirae bacterium]|nr:c-type cytochrome [Nitrospirota bacterium]